MTDNTAGSVIAAILALATAIHHNRPRTAIEAAHSDPRAEVINDYKSFGGKVEGE